jgi:HEAT repeat protein
MAAPAHGDSRRALVGGTTRWGHATSFRSERLALIVAGHLDANNAAVVLGNDITAEDAEAVRRALDDSEPLVREHAAWALSAPHSKCATS